VAGPDVQYAGELPWDDLEVRIHPVANGSFTLYEDSGDGYDYERGVFTEILFCRDDSAQDRVAR